METTFAIVNDNVRKNAIGAILDLPLEKYLVVIKGRGKTNTQRAYWHLCLTITAKAYGESVERLKHLIKENVLGLDKWTDTKGNPRSRVKSSEELNTKDYSALIDYTHIVANHLNVTLPDPRDYGLER